MERRGVVVGFGVYFVGDTGGARLGLPPSDDVSCAWRWRNSGVNFNGPLVKRHDRIKI
jgi:hypothetical protein